MLNILGLSTNYVTKNNYFLPMIDYLDKEAVQSVLKNSNGDNNIITTPALLPVLQAAIDTANYFVFSQKHGKDIENNITYFDDISFINNVIQYRTEYIMIVGPKLFNIFEKKCFKVYLYKIDTDYQGTEEQIVPDFSNLNYSSEKSNDLNLEIRTSSFNADICQKQKMISSALDIACFLNCKMSCPYLR